MGEIKFKSFGTRLIDIDSKEGVVTGYLASFDVVDSYGDRILPGAFTKTIVERGPEGSNRIKHLWMHDPWNPVGKYLELCEDDYGLKFMAQIAPTGTGKDLLILYEEGVITEHSIGYDPVQSDVMVENEVSINLLKEIKLWEGSAVTWGANEYTPVLSVKSATNDQLDILIKRINKINKVLKKGHFNTDELPEVLLRELKFLEQSASAVKRALEEPTEPGISTLKLKEPPEIKDQQAINAMRELKQELQEKRKKRG